MFSQIPLYLIKYLLQLEIMADMLNGMSRILSHSVTVTVWNNYIPAFLTAIYKGEKETHVNCFVNFLSACVLMCT